MLQVENEVVEDNVGSEAIIVATSQDISMHSCFYTDTIELIFISLKSVFRSKFGLSNWCSFSQQTLLTLYSSGIGQLVS